MQRRHLQFRRTHRSSALRQHGIDADAAQEGTFSCHIRTAHDDELKIPVQPKIIDYGPFSRDQRMGQRLSFETRCVLGKFRKHILGMLIGVASQGSQRLQWPNRFQPQAERRTETSTPLSVARTNCSR